MDRSSAVFVTEHGGMAGKAIVERLRRAGFSNLLLPGPSELDLNRQDAVEAFFRSARPAYVFLTAGKYGGIAANQKYPADLLLDNLRIQTNVLHSAWQAGTKRLLYLASACIYPRLCPQPMREESLLTGPFEPTNAAYSAAKLAGLAMCEAYNRQHGTHFIPAIPTNVYGPFDDFDEENAHVCAALMRRLHERRLAWEKGDRASMTVWGTGAPRREFLHVDDLAAACLFLMESDRPPDVINIGSGEDVSIRDLALLLKRIAGFQGDVAFDASRPDGMPLKSLDGSRLLALGWQPRIPLEAGLRSTYDWFARERPAGRPS